MIAFHADRSLLLPFGPIHLADDYDNIEGFDVISKHFCMECFPEGISMFGLIYSGVFPFPGNDTLIAVTEMLFEYIRQLRYPSLPSRFQSMFFSPTGDGALRWARSMGHEGPIRICKCEITHEFIADATFRDKATNWMQYNQKYSPSLAYQCAIQYWSGMFSESPNIEIVARLPITVLSAHMTN